MLYPPTRGLGLGFGLYPLNIGFELFGLGYDDEYAGGCLESVVVSAGDIEEEVRPIIPRSGSSSRGSGCSSGSGVHTSLFRRSGMEELGSEELLLAESRSEL